MIENSRHAALQVLSAIVHKGRDCDRAFAENTLFVALEQRDRAFCMQLVMTCLRRQGTIDRIVKERLQKPLEKRYRIVETILKLGITELLWLHQPAYATVNSMVELTRAGKCEKYTGLVNAVLKRVAADASLPDRIDQELCFLPDWLWRSWCDAYGEETTRNIIRICQQEPPLDITLKRPKEREQWKTVLEARCLPTGSLRRDRAGNITQLPGYDTGDWWIQDAAAALPVMLCGDVSGKHVLDLCAAPGGKTAQLAAAGATVTALDRSAARLKRLRENLHRLNLPAEIIQDDATGYHNDDNQPYDLVVLDAPCSATGTLRRHPDLIGRRTPEDIVRLAEIQQRMLRHAATHLVRSGRRTALLCLFPATGRRRGADRPFPE